MAKEKSLSERIEELSEDSVLSEDDERLESVLEAEACLLDAFTECVRKIKSLKYKIGPNMGIPYRSSENDSLRDAIKNRKWSIKIRKKLHTKAKRKVDVLCKVIDDVFAPSEEEEEEKLEFQKDENPRPQYERGEAMHNRIKKMSYY